VTATRVRPQILFHLLCIAYHHLSWLKLPTTALVRSFLQLRDGGSAAPLIGPFTVRIYGSGYRARDMAMHGYIGLNKSTRAHTSLDDALKCGLSVHSQRDSATTSFTTDAA
jgi:hypothetical protein